MSKSVDELCTSELLYYITKYKPDYEYKNEVKRVIYYRLKSMYNYNDTEIKQLINIETKKIEERGSDLNNYLFSHNLSSTDKIKMIYDLYEKDELYKLTLGETSIALNLLMECEDHYINKINRVRNDDNRRISLLNYSIQTKISDETLENYSLIAVTKRNPARYRPVYYETHSISNEDKENIKAMIKTNKFHY